MDAISNPARARRGDRRRTRRQVDDAFARGLITAADRATRLSHVEAATTKGDLAMIVRDLIDRRPAPAVQGRPVGPRPGQGSAPVQGGFAPGVPMRGPASAPPATASGPRNAAVIGGVVAAMAVSGVLVIGVLAFVASSNSADRVTAPTISPKTPAATSSTEVVDTLLTQAQWDDLVSSLEASNGGSEVYGLDVYQYSATAKVPVGSKYAFDNYGDGSWTRSSSATFTPYDDELFDLSTLAPDFVDRLRRSVAERSDVSLDQVRLMTIRIVGETPDRVTVRYTDQESFVTSEEEFGLDGDWVG